MDNFGDMTVDFLNFLEIHLNDSSCLRDFGAYAIEFFEIRRFLLQLPPELVMQPGRQQHGLLTKWDMIIKSNDIN
jgi:hypothetical protein